VDAAVENLIASGVQAVIAAGNNNNDACNYSPGCAAEAINVGATASTDARAWFSNYGSCIDFFAPGEGITSAWNSSDTATIIASGTSMSAPHVSGVAAMYLEANPTATPQEVRDAIYDATTKDIVTNSNSTNDHLLYSRRR
jgi:subtilisin family serine protease